MTLQKKEEKNIGNIKIVRKKLNNMIKMENLLKNGYQVLI